MTLVHVDGASGYAAGELIRLLASHREFRIGVLASVSAAGTPVAETFPSLAPLGLRFAGAAQLLEAVGPTDAVVHAGDHEHAPDRVAAFLERGARVVDLSGAHRLSDLASYECWYGFAHPRPELVMQAVYGLPELYTQRVSDARLVANPGCYPTAVLLALAPLVRAFGGAIAGIVVDAKSGISGAGRKPSVSSLFSEIDGTIRPYAYHGHRHVAEIKEQLDTLGFAVPFTFVPHVVPLSRGMLTTCYVSFSGPAPEAEELVAEYSSAYETRPLVHVLPADELPETRGVARTARSIIGAARVGFDLAVVACAIDNLGKGAAAQALQNLNLMFGHAEDLGLEDLAGVA